MLAARSAASKILISCTAVSLSVSKCVLLLFQLVGCVYIRHLFSSSCWVIQLFGINCLLPNQDSESIIKAGKNLSAACGVQERGFLVSDYDYVCAFSGDHIKLYVHDQSEKHT